MSPSDINVINTKLEYVQEKIESLHDMVKSHITQEEAQWEKIQLQNQKDFARKWVEVVMSFIAITVWTSLLGWFIVQQSNVNEFLIKNNYPSQK